MPRLIEYISVGFCAGYGDGDYRVSGSIQSLDRKAFKELQLAVLGALRCAEDTWRAGQAQEVAYTQALSPTPAPKED